MIKIVREIHGPNNDAIDVLKKALERVESGELKAVALSWVDKDDGIGGDVSSSNNAFIMWASLEHSARQFYNNVIVGED